MVTAGFEFTIHFYYCRAINQYKLTKETIETAVEKYLKFWTTNNWTTIRL